MQKWIYVIILLTGYSIRSYTQKTINLNIPVEQNWMFDNEHPVRFMLELTSAQSGFSDRIRMDIATDFGNAVSSTFITYSFGTDSIAPGGGFRSRASVTLTNLTPGFYQVCFIAGTDTLKHFFFGYEAEQILSKPDGPPNLKRFWNKTITELKRVHPAYKMTRLPESSKPERDVYEVEMRSLEGEILRGYWAVPTDGQSHPAVVVYQGYDAVTWIPSPDDYPGWCILVIPPRGQGLNKPYNRFGEWIAFGLDSPKHYYYRGAFADTVRSIDFIFAQPCFDGQNLFATGISQGGALTLAAASLDHRISAAAPIVPFLSDYPDYFRLVHWPANLVFEGAARQNIDKDKIFSLLTYFDLKNLTGWIKCPVLMGFGLQDNITPPHTNFAAYNHIRTPKRWICYPTSGHFAAYENMDSWIAESTRFFNQYVVWQ